jgi:hypothetical protein
MLEDLQVAVGLDPPRDADLEPQLTIAARFRSGITVGVAVGPT